MHELTHALDGQHADLTLLTALSETAEETGNYEPLVAFQAVAEGRATSVQNRWMAENGVVQELPDDLGALEDVPPALVLSLSIPCAFGEQYIERQGGAAVCTSRTRGARCQIGQKESLRSHSGGGYERRLAEL